MDTHIKSLAVALSLLLVAAPCSADVIGSRPKRAPTRDRVQVARHLERLGIHPGQARSETAGLSARDLEYFASHPGRIVLAGAQDKSDSGFFAGESSIRWYEIVGGIVALGGVIAFVTWKLIDARN